MFVDVDTIICICKNVSLRLHVKLPLSRATNDRTHAFSFHVKELKGMYCSTFAVKEARVPKHIIVNFYASILTEIN